MLDCLFLGTGASINTVKRHNASLFFRKGGGGVMIDVNGVCVQRLTAEGIAFDELQHIFITHEHVDHMAAVVNLLHQIWAKTCYYNRPGTERRTAPLHFYAPRQTMDRVKALFDVVQLPTHPHMFPLHFHVLDEAGGTLSLDGIEMSYFPVCHAHTPCMGLKVTEGARSLVYSADTCPMESLYTSLTAGDVLIHECNNILDPTSPGHTTWQEIEAFLPSVPTGVTVYLIHLPLMTEEEEAVFKERLEKDWAGKVVLAEDGTKLTI